MAKTVTIDIDVESGSFTLDGTLFLGERVAVQFTGVDAAPSFHVFAGDGVTVLADNFTDSGYLDLRSDTLRKAFHGQRTVHQFMAFAKTQDPEVLCRGFVNVCWAPYQYDATTGHTATMKGDRGDRGYGIDRIELVGRSDDGDTYRVFFEDGRYSDFTAPRGPKGDMGPFIDAIDVVGPVEGGTAYRIKLTNGATFDFTAPQGPKGDTGGVSAEEMAEAISSAAAAIRTQLDGKQDRLTAGNHISIGPDGTISYDGPLLTSYDELANKPSIGGVELESGMTLADLGILSAEQIAGQIQRVSEALSTSIADVLSTAQNALETANGANEKANGKADCVLNVEREPTRFECQAVGLERPNVWTTIYSLSWSDEHNAWVYSDDPPAGPRVWLNANGRFETDFTNNFGENTSSGYWYDPLDSILRIKADVVYSPDPTTAKQAAKLTEHGVGDFLSSPAFATKINGYGFATSTQLNLFAKMCQYRVNQHLVEEDGEDVTAQWRSITNLKVQSVSESGETISGISIGLNSSPDGIIGVGDWIVYLSTEDNVPSIQWRLDGWTIKTRKDTSWDEVGGMIEANKDYIYTFTDMGDHKLFVTREEVV